MEKRKYRTKEEKQVLVKNYLESGLSRKAWCSKNNIPISTLVGWEKQLNRINKDEIIFISPKPSKRINKEKRRPSVANDKVIIAEPAVFTAILETHECKLHINEKTPISFISQLLQVLREAYV